MLEKIIKLKLAVRKNDVQEIIKCLQENDFDLELFYIGDLLAYQYICELEPLYLQELLIELQDFFTQRLMAKIILYALSCDKLTAENNIQLTAIVKQPQIVRNLIMLIPEMEKISVENIIQILGTIGRDLVQENMEVRSYFRLLSHCFNRYNIASIKNILAIVNPRKKIIFTAKMTYKLLDDLIKNEHGLEPFRFVTTEWKEDILTAMRTDPKESVTQILRHIQFLLGKDKFYISRNYCADNYGLLLFLLDQLFTEKVEKLEFDFEIYEVICFIMADVFQQDVCSELTTIMEKMETINAIKKIIDDLETILSEHNDDQNNEDSQCEEEFTCENLDRSKEVIHKKMAEIIQTFAIQMKNFTSKYYFMFGVCQILRRKLSDVTSDSNSIDKYYYINLWIDFCETLREPTDKVTYLSLLILRAETCEKFNNPDALIESLKAILLYVKENLDLPVGCGQDLRELHNKLPDRNQLLMKELDQYIVVLSTERADPAYRTLIALSLFFNMLESNDTEDASLAIKGTVSNICKSYFETELERLISFLPSITANFSRVFKLKANIWSVVSYIFFRAKQVNDFDFAMKQLNFYIDQIKQVLHKLSYSKRDTYLFLQIRSYLVDILQTKLEYIIADYKSRIVNDCFLEQIKKIDALDDEIVQLKQNIILHYLTIILNDMRVADSGTEADGSKKRAANSIFMKEFFPYLNSNTDIDVSVFKDICRFIFKLLIADVDSDNQNNINLFMISFDPSKLDALFHDRKIKRELKIALFNLIIGVIDYITKMDPLFSTKKHCFDETSVSALILLRSEVLEYRNALENLFARARERINKLDKSYSQVQILAGYLLSKRTLRSETSAANNTHRIIFNTSVQKAQQILHLPSKLKVVEEAMLELGQVCSALHLWSLSNIYSSCRNRSTFMQNILALVPNAQLSESDVYENLMICREFIDRSIIENKANKNINDDYMRLNFFRRNKLPLIISRYRTIEKSDFAEFSEEKAQINSGADDDTILFEIKLKELKASETKHADVLREIMVIFKVTAVRKKLLDDLSSCITSLNKIHNTMCNFEFANFYHALNQLINFLLHEVRGSDIIQRYKLVEAFDQVCFSVDYSREEKEKFLSQCLLLTSFLGKNLGLFHFSIVREVTNWVAHVYAIAEQMHGLSLSEIYLRNPSIYGETVVANKSYAIKVAEAASQLSNSMCSIVFRAS